MKLAYTIMYVEDVPVTVKQWATCLGFTVSYMHEDDIYAELETGETTLAFADIEFGRSHFDDPSAKSIFDRPVGRFEIGLFTKNVPECYQHAIDHGMTPIKPPVIQPWGQEVAWIADRNGILIKLSTPNPEPE